MYMALLDLLLPKLIRFDIIPGSEDSPALWTKCRRKDVYIDCIHIRTPSTNFGYLFCPGRSVHSRKTTPTRNLTGAHPDGWARVGCRVEAATKAPRFHVGQAQGDTHRNCGAYCSDGWGWCRVHDTILRAA